ncbi:Cytosolic sulfotransferase 17 [Acorus gramineus]|uniref:Sulfotransferase n=1 Tax=Acorus gramineus TaxID=55184 RepID=A0AAV9A3N9_ACOGR|nr:Cytosolic sulfotransferase 17 [Acorus gramineus]
MEEEVRGADEKTEETYAHIISTLPKKKSWGQELQRYQGFWYYPFFLDGVISVQHNFKVRPSDVLIASSPKSGTTWLKALVFAIHNRRLLATHIPYSSLPGSARDDDSGCRIVYISRDIKDVFVSSWYFFNDNSLEEAFESYCDGVTLYGPIWDHQLEYWKASIERPQSVVFLRYEDMMEDPVNGVKRLAEFLGRPFSMEEEEGGVVKEIVKVCSFKYLKNLEANKEGELQFAKVKFTKPAFFRRGVVGDSKSCLTPEMIERLNLLNDRMTCSSSSSSIP